jgi:DNA replication protein DnaC
MGLDIGYLVWMISLLIERSCKMMASLQENLSQVRRSLKGIKWTEQQVARASESKRQEQALRLGICRADCEICDGQGYLRKDVPIYDPKFGKMYLCPNSDRWRQPGNARCGISIRESKQLTWCEVEETDSIRPAVEAVRAALAQGYGWVYLHGGFGTGKTQVMKIAVAEAMRAGQTAAYVRMAEILDHLREAFQSDSKVSERSRLAWWAQLPVLAIDEFDRVRDTGYGEERRFVLLDRRYEQAIRQEGVTLMASNLEPANLPDYLYDRIRIGRFQVVYVSGKSFRPGMEA